MAAVALPFPPWLSLSSDEEEEAGNHAKHRVGGGGKKPHLPPDPDTAAAATFHDVVVSVHQIKTVQGEKIAFSWGRKEGRCPSFARPSM